MSAYHAKNNIKIVGLTGGIATGKSTVSKYLTDKGFLVFDSDYSVRNIWNENEELKKYIKNKYKIDLNLANGKKELAELIFNNPATKAEVESLIHPYVFKEIEQWITKNNKEKLLFLDIPLLFEIGYHKKVDITVLVYTKKALQLKRLINRNKINEDEAIKMINSQIDIEQKKAMANYILNNNDGLNILYQQVDQLIEELLK